jgi:hypothetical protein
VSESSTLKNKITCLERDSFVLLTELQNLHLWRCGLRTIKMGAFNGLTMLTHLFIVNNEMCEIIPGTFENMINLENLNLAGNRIEHVDRDMFSGLFKLKYINLSGNKLQYLHPDTFLMLPNLQELNFDENPSLHIQTDRNFIKSHSLSHLDISLCNISTVSVETFANVSALEWLDLCNNNLKTLNINILTALPKLSTLYLHGNPLHYDCQLQEEWRLCKDLNMWPGNHVRSNTPSEVNGMVWAVLDKGQCLQDNIQYNGDYKNYTDTEISFSYKYTKKVFKGLPSTNICSFLYIWHNRQCHHSYHYRVQKGMRTVPNMYILNLAISDIIYLMAHFSDACANTISVGWRTVGSMCIFLPFCRRLPVCLSAYSVAVLSIQRYRVTVNPYHVRVSSKPTWRGIMATIFGVWILSALLAVLSTLSRYECLHDPVTPIMYYQRVVIFELLASCALPLCVIAFTYIMTARHLVESCRSISEGIQNPQLKTRRNTAKIVVGLTCFYDQLCALSCLVDIHYLDPSLFLFFRMRCGVILYKNYGMPYVISTCFLLINSCLNPIVLFCTSSPFRQHLKRYLTCFCKTSSPSTELELARRN